MVFNSLAFAGFFASFFLLYWGAFGRHARAQTLFLCLGSWAFYTWADPRSFPILLAATAIDYCLGLALGRASSQRMRLTLLLIGLFSGLAPLAFFKYAQALLSFLPHGALSGIAWVLPLGISFYTFRGLGYLIDVYKEKTAPIADPVEFAAFLGFFPSLVSGPIDKASLLRPQIAAARVFDYGEAVEGMRQFAQGLVKKAVVADNCAAVANPIFMNYRDLPASSLLLGAFLYTIQIYADFSGYSDMAIGCARLLGFRITRNFANPFFSQNISEFWRKWHVSLTAWMTEYVFTPLSILFRDLGKSGLALAIVINFTLIGIWHGSRWNFVLFGFLHGCFFIPLILKGTINKRKEIAAGKALPSAAEFRNMAATFACVMLSFVVFRMPDVPEGFRFLAHLASPSLFAPPAVQAKTYAACAVALSLGLLAFEWFNRTKPFAASRLGETWPGALRWAVYYGLAALIFVLAGTGQNFIYFQF